MFHLVSVELKCQEDTLKQGQHSHRPPPPLPGGGWGLCADPGQAGTRRLMIKIPKASPVISPQLKKAHRLSIHPAALTSNVAFRKPPRKPMRSLVLGRKQPILLAWCLHLSLLFTTTRCRQSGIAGCWASGPQCG